MKQHGVYVAEPGLIQALSNRVNQAILGVLAVEPSYPRRIGTLLSLPETEAARRLRALEGLGLVAGEWANIGRNVKLYRLCVTEVNLRFSAGGIEVSLSGSDGLDVAAPRIEAVAETAPSPAAFVGRARELALLSGPRPVVLVAGIPGIGKTSLIAHFAMQARREGNVFWQQLRGVESLNWLANRLALFYAQEGDRRLLEALEQDAERADRYALMLAGLRERRLTYVFDDVHRIEDEALNSFLSEVVANPGHSRVILAGRLLPRHQPGAHVTPIVLGGMADDEVLAFMAMKGLPEQRELLPALRAATGGHPLALNLLFEAARAAKRPLPEVVLSLPRDGLEEYLLREVDETLSDEERRVLTIASVFRTTFTLDDLSAISTRDVQAALRRLRQRHLAEARGEEHFLHEVLRNFFYAQVADKAGLHARAAERYLGQATIEGRLEAMHHYLAAGLRDRVLELLDEDLDLDDFDLIDAGYHNLYSAVLSQFTREEILLPRRWGLIEDERGDIAFSRRDDEAALRHYEEALAVFTKEEDKDRLADLHWKRGRALARMGRMAEARREVKAGLAAGARDELALRRLQTLDAELAK